MEHSQTIPATTRFFFALILFLPLIFFIHNILELIAPLGNIPEDKKINDYTTLYDKAVKQNMNYNDFKTIVNDQSQMEEMGVTSETKTLPEDIQPFVIRQSILQAMYNEQQKNFYALAQKPFSFPSWILLLINTVFTWLVTHIINRLISKPVDKVLNAIWGKLVMLFKKLNLRSFVTKKRSSG